MRVNPLCVTSPWRGDWFNCFGPEEDRREPLIRLCKSPSPCHGILTLTLIENHWSTTRIPPSCWPDHCVRSWVDASYAKALSVAWLSKCDRQDSNLHPPCFSRRATFALQSRHDVIKHRAIPSHPAINPSALAL